MDDGIEFDASGLEELGRDLRHAAHSVRHEVEQTVWKIGAEVAETAKVIASQHSTTIPGTIKFRPLPGAAVVSAGSDEVAIAVLFELGNKGKGGRTATTFRHPVFGNQNVWVTQPKHPFLRPALALDRRSITHRMELAWDSALWPYRLKPEGLG